MRIVGRAAPGELVHIVFAHDDGAGLLERESERRIGCRDIIFEDSAACRGALARHVNIVFERHRNSVERPQIVAAVQHNLMRFSDLE